jgi:hypothetical protein
MTTTNLINAIVQYMQQPFAWVGLISMSCALIGSLVLALKGKYAGWGWVLFAASNAGWIVFAYGYEHWFFLVQQIGFSVTSALGIWTYLVRPAATSPNQIILWRTAPPLHTSGLWRITQMPSVANIWRNQGRKVQGLTAAGDWE